MNDTREERRAARIKALRHSANWTIGNLERLDPSRPLHLKHGSPMYRFQWALDSLAEVSYYDPILPVGERITAMATDGAPIKEIIGALHRFAVSL